MRIVVVSDTHMAHARLEIPPCDLLVHAGDVTRRGRREELSEFVAWFAAQPGREKVFVAGNHDRICEKDPAFVRELASRHGVHYLEDETISLFGLRVHGSPITPSFANGAFNRDRGESIRKHWALVPRGVDVLVTHGPPKGILDRTFLGMHVGCEELRAALPRIAPRVHLFGHIHEAGGSERRDASTRYVNAASLRLVPIGRPRPATVVDV